MRIVQLGAALGESCGQAGSGSVRQKASLTPAGVASADGVAESRCGARVEDECDSSDPLSGGGTA